MILCRSSSSSYYCNPCLLSAPRDRPCRTLREFLFTKLRGSRESWTPPACLRLTRKALLLPEFGGLELFCNLQTPPSSCCSSTIQDADGAKRTDNLPNEIRGDVRKGHFSGIEVLVSRGEETCQRNRYSRCRPRQLVILLPEPTLQTKILCAVLGKQDPHFVPQV